MYEIAFNDVRNSIHGLVVTKRPSVPAPEETVETFTVAGREGILTGERRLQPIEIAVELAFRCRPDDWAEQMRNVKQWLQGSGTFKQSDDVNWFYKVNHVQITAVERELKRYGRITATFNCDPYMYSIAGQREYSIDDESILNNRYETCHPMYIFPGSGMQTITVNGNTATISGSGAVVVDTDRMITYTQTTHGIESTRLTGDYEDLYLLSGENEISSSGPVTIIPNWRTR